VSTIEKTVSSECGRYMAEIVRRGNGVFQVTIFQWIEECVEEYGVVPGYRVPVSRSATFTDTVENAEKLAQEAFSTFASD
jgi:hypothetical protein